jgi:undecaprenyl diphosphate synthase
MSHANTDLSNTVPRHVVIIMDGNGRWAKQRGLSRISGHKAGVATLRNIVEVCAVKKIEALTVYAFSSENWKRPGSEVSRLLELFMTSLKKEVDNLNKNNIRLRFIGDLKVFPANLKTQMTKATKKTESNTGLQFAVAINYGGRWDITNAFRQLVAEIGAGKVNADEINETLIASRMSLADLPEPDLFIRTGGEMRISNYLLWHLAYTELYFTECLWPDFGTEEFNAALAWYAGRERRFGQISEQLKQANHA